MPAAAARSRSEMISPRLMSEAGSSLICQLLQNLHRQSQAMLILWFKKKGRLERYIWRMIFKGEIISSKLSPIFYCVNEPRADEQFIESQSS